MTVLVIAALLALCLSLVVTARQFLAKLELAKHRDELLLRLTGGTNGRIQEITERQIRDFDAALHAYDVAVTTAQQIEATALRELIQDLRVLANIAAYPESAGWAHAFSVVIGIRVRLIVGRLVFAHVPSGSEPVRVALDRLLILFKGWATLAASYDDFTQPLAFRAPGESAQRAWQDLSLAQGVAAETQEVARTLLAVLEKAQ